MLFPRISLVLIKCRLFAHEYKLQALPSSSALLIFSRFMIWKMPVFTFFTLFFVAFCATGPEIWFLSKCEYHEYIFVQSRKVLRLIGIEKQKHNQNFSMPGLELEGHAEKSRPFWKNQSIKTLSKHYSLINQKAFKV